MTMRPDFVAADRRHLIEELCSASGPDTVAINLVAHVVEMLPAHIEGTKNVNLLLEAIHAKSADAIKLALADLRLEMPIDVDQQPLWRDLRDGIALLCATGEVPESAAPMAHAYAALAVELSRWLRDSVKRATSLQEKAVVRRVEQRARLARLLSTGWAALAAGESSDYAEASATTHAAALGADVEAATAPREVLPEPDSREEEVALDDGWRRRIDALYGHLGIGHVAVGRGWFSLVEETLEAIDASLLPGEAEAFRVSDIKEKYGTLRIYVANAPDAVEVLIEIAERRSALICDRCGDHGRVVGGGRLACRCGRHEEQ